MAVGTDPHRDEFSSLDTPCGNRAPEPAMLEGHRAVHESVKGIRLGNRESDALSLHSVVMSPGRSRRRVGMRAAGAVVCAGALVACVALMVWRKNMLSAAPARPSELLWSKYHLEEEEKDPDDVDSMRKAREAIALREAAKEAVRVGTDLKDDKRVGVILGRLTQVAFDSVLELKRAMRGLRGRDADMEASSKVRRC